MSMPLYTQRNEVRCILTLTSTKLTETQRSTLLGQLTPEHFLYGPCSETFNRIAAVAKKRHILLDKADLLEDPALDEDIRELFSATKLKFAPTTAKIDRMVESLEEYRKLRCAHAIATGVLEKMSEGKIEDIDELLNTMGDGLAIARKNINSSQTMVRIGRKHNADDHVHAALHKVKETMIKTGFTEYDQRNGGLPEHGVMILGATTSGGKTATLMNLAHNIYLKANRDVLRVSLEMSEQQEMHRMLSMLTGIPFFRFKHHKLTAKEKRIAEKAFAKFKKHGKENKCQYDFICPTRGMTITEILAMAKPYGYGVIGIDYISLLEGVDEDNQWRVLSAIARECKVYSRETGSLIILLCQIDDETNKLRYSKGVKEHADVMWSWNYSKPEQRELKILPVSVDKARDGELFGFDLEEAFATMQVLNPRDAGNFAASDDSADTDSLHDGVDVGKKKKKKEKDESDDYALK
jgi:replicative DNA helicase